MTNEEKAREYAQLHLYDGDQVQLYVECHNGKIAAFKAGAEWKEQQMIEKVCEWLKNNAGEHIYFDECDNEWYDAEELIEDFKKAMMGE